MTDSKFLCLGSWPSPHTSSALLLPAWLQVPYAHKDLSSGLDLSGYTNELHEVVSIQTCSTQQEPASAAGSTGSNTDSFNPDQLRRLAGRDAAYAFVFPTLMVNRYGESSGWQGHLLQLLAHQMAAWATGTAETGRCCVMDEAQIAWGSALHDPCAGSS